MRHLAVGQACPKDDAVVGRSHCSACPSFVSFRAQSDVAVVGCDWGQDMAGWLRREMRRVDPPSALVRHPDRRPALRSDRTVTRPAGAIGLFLAAFGVGVVLSALDRPG